MTEGQLRTLLAGIIIEGPGFKGLSFADSEWASKHPKDVVALAVAGIRNREGRKATTPVPAPDSPLLQWVGTIPVPATPAFKVSELFVVNTSDNARVKIQYVDPAIGDWFEDEVPDNPGSELRYADLTRDAYDRDIIKELGGKEKYAVSLSEVYLLMEKQRDGKEGALLNNGSANIFYVRNRSGALRAVCVYWCADGWSVGARKLVFDNWDESRRVFSRSAVGSGNSCDP